MTNEKGLHALSAKMRERYYAVLAAAIQNDECPKEIVLGPLTDSQLIRVETYAIWGEHAKNVRVVTILTGDHSGKQTRKPGWIQAGQMPIKIQDGRPNEVIRRLNLPTNADLVRKMGKKKPSLEIPDWKTWGKD